MSPSATSVSSCTLIPSTDQIDHPQRILVESIINANKQPDRFSLEHSLHESHTLSDTTTSSNITRSGSHASGLAHALTAPILSPISSSDSIVQEVSASAIAVATVEHSMRDPFTVSPFIKYNSVNGLETSIIQSSLSQLPSPIDQCDDV